MPPIRFSFAFSLISDVSLWMFLWAVCLTKHLPDHNLYIVSLQRYYPSLVISLKPGLILALALLERIPQMEFLRKKKRWLKSLPQNSVSSNSNKGCDWVLCALNAWRSLLVEFGSSRALKDIWFAIVGISHKTEFNVPRTSVMGVGEELSLSDLILKRDDGSCGLIRSSNGIARAAEWSCFLEFFITSGVVANSSKPFI